MKKEISPSFLMKAASIICETYNGLKGHEIQEYFMLYKNFYQINKELDLENFTKTTIFINNIIKFNSNQQFAIIKAMCKNSRINNDKDVKELLKDLYNNYYYLDNKDGLYNHLLFYKTLNLLNDYPDVLKTYKKAIKYYQRKEFNECLNNLRISIEILLKILLKNKCSLENQKKELKELLKNKNISDETRNILGYYLTIYCDKQNNQIKHFDFSSINSIEIDLYVELSNLFINNLILYLN